MLQTGSRRGSPGREALGRRCWRRFGWVGYPFPIPLDGTGRRDKRSIPNGAAARPVASAAGTGPGGSDGGGGECAPPPPTQPCPGRHRALLAECHWHRSVPLNKHREANFPLLDTESFWGCFSGWYSSVLQSLGAQDGGPARLQAPGRCERRSGGRGEAAQWSAWSASLSPETWPRVVTPQQSRFGKSLWEIN